MNHRWILIVLASLLAVSAFADSKFGRQVRYLGFHPIPKSQGGGICYIEGPHVHIYAANKVEFRTVAITSSSAIQSRTQVRGTLIIVVADRHKADPNGRTINQIFKLVPS